MTSRRLALASAACAVACGRPAPRAARPSLVTITATDYAFGVPDTIPAGLTTFRLVNQGKELHHETEGDRKSTRLNSSHGYISYAVFCLKKKNNNKRMIYRNELYCNELPGKIRAQAWYAGEFAIDGGFAS